MRPPNIKIWCHRLPAAVTKLISRQIWSSLKISATISSPRHKKEARDERGPSFNTNKLQALKLQLRWVPSKKSPQPHQLLLLKKASQVKLTRRRWRKTKGPKSNWSSSRYQRAKVKKVISKFLHLRKPKQIHLHTHPITEPVQNQSQTSKIIRNNWGDSILTRSMRGTKCILKCIKWKVAKIRLSMTLLLPLRWQRSLSLTKISIAKTTGKSQKIKFQSAARKRYSNLTKCRMKCSRKIFRSFIEVATFSSVSLIAAFKLTKKGGTQSRQSHLPSISLIVST